MLHSHAQLVPSARRWGCPISRVVCYVLQGDTAAPRDWLPPQGSALLGKQAKWTRTSSCSQTDYEIYDILFAFNAVSLSIIKPSLCSVSSSGFLIYHLLHPTSPSQTTRSSSSRCPQLPLYPWFCFCTASGGPNRRPVLYRVLLPPGYHLYGPLPPRQLQLDKWWPITVSYYTDTLFVTLDVIDGVKCTFCNKRKWITYVIKKQLLQINQVEIFGFTVIHTIFYFQFILLSDQINELCSWSTRGSFNRRMSAMFAWSLLRQGWPLIPIWALWPWLLLHRRIQSGCTLG